jgi:uncharacterized membrane protein (UPF0136 family)
MTLLLIVIGLALVGGTITVLLPTQLVPDTFQPLDHYVGTEGSVVGGVFGLGLIWAARHPAQNRIWIHLAMLYSILLLAREAILAMNGKPASLQPIVFGVATLALLLALYPGFGRKPAVAVAPPAGASPAGPSPAGPSAPVPASPPAATEGAAPESAAPAAPAAPAPAPEPPPAT